MIVDANFEDEHFELLRDILARIGLADVREFGLSWDDCNDYLHKLGYDIKVEVSEEKCRARLLTLQSSSGNLK